MTRLTVDLLNSEAAGLSQMCKRFTFDDAERFANRHDGGYEREAILGAVQALQKALAEVGYAPR